MNSDFIKSLKLCGMAPDFTKADYAFILKHMTHLPIKYLELPENESLTTDILIGWLKGG